MTDSQTIDQLKERFIQCGQGHVFNFFSDLSTEEKAELIEQLIAVDLEELQSQLERLIHGDTEGSPSSFDWNTLEPASYIARPENGGSFDQWDAALKAGEDALRAGRVAAFTVAGGQGTRLGYDGPKGSFVVTPLSGKSLFEVFADKIARASERYEVSIPWCIMTSTINHDATVEFFEAKQYFGLAKDSVYFFPQALFPAVDLKGKILMETKSRIVRTPNGHGGSLKALVDSGVTEKLCELGIDILSYFQVDNPLVPCIDPAFIGFHVLQKSELSSKMIPKAYPGEKVGLFCTNQGAHSVIEYSDMPRAIQESLDDSGNLRFRAGSVAIHLFDRAFVERIGSGASEDRLPYHKALKKISSINVSEQRNEHGSTNATDSNMGVKFELFVFDALPLAKNPVIIEGVRSDNFSPVKNLEGADSPESARKDQCAQAQIWLKAAGENLELDPSVRIEMNYRFAMDEADFVEQWTHLETKPEITDGSIIGD